MSLSDRCIHGLLCTSSKTCVWCSTHTRLECHTPLRRYWCLLKGVLSGKDMATISRRLKTLLSPRHYNQAVGAEGTGESRKAPRRQRSREVVH